MGKYDGVSGASGGIPYREGIWGFGGTARYAKLGGDTGRNYYVDAGHPRAVDAGNDGMDPENPFATIQAAITANNALIDWAGVFGGLMPYSTIWVAPGVYAENLTPAYFCRIIGTGNIGTDAQAEIHPAAGSALAGLGLCLSLHNLWFESETAVPVIDFGICNNVMIEGCEIARGIAGLATMAIQFDNVSFLRFLDNHISSGVANFPIGMQFTAGFIFASVIAGNDIFAATTGIDIAGGIVANACIIKHNTIVGRPVTGINDLSGTSWVVDNWISASVDAILHANSATNCIANHVLDAAVGAVEAAGTD
jgi:hypothetical protein